jgi:hypothetical protein
MLFTRLIRLVSTTAAICAMLAANNAFANTTIFIPVTGDAFALYAGSVEYTGAGGVYNPGSSPSTIVASLGHAGGGSNGFYVQGNNVGGTMVCTVYVYSGTSGVLYGYGGSVSASGYYNLFINTNPPTGDYFYALACQLPPGSEILGTFPNH